jgi:TetR/AcrR family transcriptional regulator of autoinduction and epiphytic fitness
MSLEAVTSVVKESDSNDEDGARTPHRHRSEFRRIATKRLPTQVRAAILDAVGKTLRGSSFDSFSMEEVAAHASISRRTLYNQFENRNDLYRAFCERMLKEVAGRVTDEIPERMAPQDGILYFVGCCMEVYGSAAAVDLLLSVMRDGKSQPWLVEAYHRDIHDRLVRACENYILKQTQSEPLAPGEPRHVGEHLVGTVRALAMDKYIFGRTARQTGPTQERLNLLANAYSSLLTNRQKRLIG